MTLKVGITQLSAAMIYRSVKTICELSGDKTRGHIVAKFKLVLLSWTWRRFCSVKGPEKSYDNYKRKSVMLLPNQSSLNHRSKNHTGEKKNFFSALA